MSSLKACVCFLCFVWFLPVCFVKREKERCGVQLVGKIGRIWEELSGNDQNIEFFFSIIEEERKVI